MSSLRLEGIRAILEKNLEEVAAISTELPCESVAELKARCGVLASVTYLKEAIKNIDELIKAEKEQ